MPSFLLFYSACVFLSAQPSEEIFDHSKTELTSVQVKQLKETMHEQFKHIYDLCYYIAQGTLQ